jgi:lysophospholipase L1-like esterase
MRRRRGLLLALMVAICAPATAAQASHGRHWRVAWATAVDGMAAPSIWTAHPTAIGAPTPAQTTYRFIIRPTLGGGRISLRFSNLANGLDRRAGTQPVTFGTVRVGVRAGDSGANVVPGTSRSVRFDGSRSTTLPPGGVGVSDPIKLRVTRLEDLVVSVYVPSSTQPPMHAQTYVTQFLTAPGAGDHAADASAAEFTEVQEPIYWLDAAFVRTRARRALVAVGDSITDGDQATVANGMTAYPDDFGIDRHLPWPDRLAKRLAADRAVAGTAVVNEGENGDLTADGAFTDGVAGRLQHDVLALRGVTHAVVEVGTNDVTAGRDAGGIIANLTSIADTLHAHGLRVIGATLVPRGDYEANDAAMSASRAQVNAFIRTSPVFDGVLDIARIVGQPGDDDRFEPASDSGDHLHPNAAGYKAIAKGFRLGLLRRGA